MPIWSGILRELAEATQQDGHPDFDAVRRKYLVQLHKHSKRNVILYASAWLQKQDATPGVVSIVDEDIQALMEVVHGLEGTDLDLVLHSPGGSPEAAEAIVSYLRSRFTSIRVIVPQLAMSAATMIACAANEIVLGKHSFLGPTDPQIVLETQLGIRLVPAQAILDQFSQAQRECENPSRLAAWLPMLSQYGPDLLVRCEAALTMSKELVKTWLQTYMFKDENDASQRAEEIAEWLADHKSFGSHSRHISRSKLEEKRLVVTPLEKDETLQDLGLSVFHATTHMFTATSAVKIVENHMGRAFIKHQVPHQATPMQALVEPPRLTGS